MKYKKCIKCQEEKSLTQYYKDKVAKDGYRGSCKTCVIAYQKEYRKKRRQENPGFESGYTKKYRENNKSKIKKLLKKWRGET